MCVIVTEGLGMGERKRMEKAIHWRVSVCDCY